MPMHMIGYELSSSLAALTALTPIPDPTLRVAGNDFFVPNGMANILAAGAMINSAVATLRMQIQSPSLRATLNADIAPIVNALGFTAPQPSMRLWDTPLPLVVNEPLDVFAQNGAAVMNRALLILGDGPVKPVLGKIFTIRATATATLVTASWVNSALTFGQTLPAGHYQCVGFRAWSANLVAARIFFVGSPWRPGVFGLQSEANQEWPDFRWGNIGVWGEFDNTVPPTVDFLGVTDSAEVVYLDLIKTA
jgi:hypothetical protein